MAALSAFRHVYMYRRPADDPILTEHQNREERQF